MWPNIASVVSLTGTILEGIRGGRFIFLHEISVPTHSETVVVDVETELGLDQSTVKAEASDLNALHKYDVFINHRGPDVKLTFAANLNEALCKAGFYPFLDAKSIGRGRHVFRSIDDALRGASVHVAIFSRGYAESPYCLEELCSMLQSKKVILPVFYDVKPEHLRYIEDGPFAEAFRKHQRRGRHAEVKKWKDALRQVAAYRGFRTNEVNRDEAQILRSIVVAVHSELPPILQPQKHQYGLTESLKEVVGLLETMKGGAGILGIVGMGGIGKTTLANKLYSHFVTRREFQCHSFLKDVRTSGSPDLQRQLVRDLIQEDIRSSSSKSYQYWFNAFRSQRLLIIVDDIDDPSQFFNLIPDIQGLAHGSRIVITSRHRDALITAMGQATYKDIYEVKVLNTIDSRQLFNGHAFDNDWSSNIFRDLAEKVADACGGHPLSLEIIGASLFDKKDPSDEAIWTDSVKTLKENSNILDKLRITYDGLPTEGDKAMFRDIACLLIGKREQEAMEIWKSCDSCGDHCSTSKVPHLSLRHLKDKSLVRLDADKCLIMHDVLRDMGRDIVQKESPRDPGRRTHLWDTATIAKVLRKKQGTDKVRGVRLSTSDSAYLAEQFSGMDELHLLELDGCSVEGDFSGWSEELRLVQWRLCPLTKLPFELNLPKLTVLDLSDSGNLTHLWQEDSHIQFPELQRLILTNCRALEELPQNIGQRLPRLKTMDLERCSMIQVLPDSIEQLKDMEHLNLSGCLNLEILPESLVNMAKLQRLLLSDCTKLKLLPSDFGKLINLEELSLSNCKDLCEVPSSVSRLQKLRVLHMEAVPIKRLPEDFGLLTCLNTLCMSRLLTIPRSFGELKSLSFLELQDCQLGGRLPSFLGGLTYLTTLDLRNNQMITGIPETFKDLKLLVYLQMSCCSTLETVEALPCNLQHLDMANCLKLISLPSFAEMSSLGFLNLCNCKILTQIWGLECLTALEEINLGGCTSLPQSGLRVIHTNTLRLCCLSGSNVSVAYDTKYLKIEPALQLISYYDSALRFLPNMMPKKLLDKGWSYDLCMNATILSNKECVAIIFTLVAHDQGWSIYHWDHGRFNSECYVEVRVMRDGMEINQAHLFSLRHADRNDQIYLCTLRRSHPLLEILKLGDKICVYARSKWSGWEITVKQGSICVVHGHEHKIIATDSKLLNRNQSAEIMATLEELNLADDYQASLVSKMGNDGPLTELNDEVENIKDSDNKNADDLTRCPINEEESSNQSWIIQPEYGEYSWTHYWTLPRAGQGIISFSARGSNDVRIAISRGPQTMNSMYEIVIGGSNSKVGFNDIAIGGWLEKSSVIRRSQRGPNICYVATGTIYPEAINHLWVLLDDNTSMIQVGRGQPFQDVICIYKDAAFLSDAQYVSFTTWDTPITYSDIQVTDLAINQVFETYKLSNKIDQQIPNSRWMIPPLYGHYNWAQFWMFPRAGRGVMSFVVEASNNVHIAISACPQTKDPMYEIMIGGWDNTISSIRRKKEGPEVCTVATGLLSTASWLWVSIDDRTGIIQMGRGEPCHDMFCIYKDASFLSESKYFSFTSWNVPVTYSEVAVTAILD